MTNDKKKSEVDYVYLIMIMLLPKQNVFDKNLNNQQLYYQLIKDKIQTVIKQLSIK